jgi:hypothetical protein
VFDPGTSTIVSTLSFASLTLDDDDSYTCYIEFGDSESAEASTTLDVIEITGLTSQGAEAGDDVSFSCSYSAGGDGDPAVVWYVGDTSVTGGITTDSSAGTTEIALTSVIYSQTGDTYYCQITYSYGSDTFTFSADAVTLYVRELTTTPVSLDYIHTGESISLVCV